MTHTKTFKFPLYTEEEYLNIVRKHLKISGNDLIVNGFPKWNRTNPGLFIRAVFTSFSINPDILPSQFILDRGDNNSVVLVSDCNSMLIKR